MKSLNRNLLAVATATALGVGGAGVTQAGVKAFSHLNIDNFQIFKSDGTTQFDTSDFAELNINNTSSTAAATAVHGGAPLNTVLDTTPGPGTDNLSCVGACDDIDDDDFTQQPAPAAGNSFARGDTLLQGALITGVEGVNNSITADAAAEAQAQNIEDDGEGNSSVGTSTEFTFIMTNDGESMTFDFDGTPYLETMLESDAGSAFASLNFSISITGDENDDGIQEEVFDYAPAALNTSRSRLSAGTTEYDPGLLSFSQATGGLQGGLQYTLSVDHRSRVTFDSESVQVAAPATLGLFGLGLLALGCMTRRKTPRRTTLAA